MQPALQPALQLTLQFADPRHRAELPRHRLMRWVRAALMSPGQITVRIVDEPEGAQLNQQFRSQDHATNVLTFDYERTPVVVADLVLCAPVVAAQALDMGIPVAAHYAHLLVHGTLHAQGFDHQAEADARVMETRETALMLALGFADPYRR